MLVVNALLSGLILGAVYALIAIGLNMQYGVARVMNLAFGEFTIVGAFLALWGFVGLGLSPILSVLVIVPLAFFVSMAIYAVFIAPLFRRAQSPGAFEVDTILATFGLLFVIQGIVVMVAGGGYQSYSFLALPVPIGEIILPANRLVAAGVSVGLVALLFAVLSRSRFGLSLRALSISPDAAPLVGIDAMRLSAVAFGIGGAIAASSGVIVSTFLAFNAAMGVVFTMKALIVVIMGGVGNMPGALAAGLILGLSEALTAQFLDPGLTLAMNFAIFMVVLLVRPNGLFGGTRA